MKAFRLLLLVLAGLVVLVGGALALFVASFDANRYKPELEALVQHKFQRTLAIGDVHLQLFPRIGIRLAQVTLSGRGGSTGFASLERAELLLAVAPLLRREAVVDRVQLAGLHATLVKHADGSTNFDDLRGQGAGQPGTRPASATPSAVGFDVSGIHVERSGLEWRDEAAGDQSDIEIERLDTGRIADHATTPVNLQATVHDRKLDTALRIALKGRLTPDLGAQSYRLSDLETRFTGSAKGYTGIDATLTGKAIDAQPDLPRISIAELGLTAAATQGTLVLHKLALAVPRLEADLKSQKVQVERLTLAVDGRADQDAVKASLAAPRLEIDGSHASGEAVHADFDLDGRSRAAHATLDLSGVEGSASTFKVGQLTLTLDAHQDASAIKGKLEGAVAGSLADQVYRIPRLAGTLAVTAPGVPGRTLQLPFELSATADLKNPRVTTDLSAAIEASHLKAHLDMSPFKNPHYGFDLTLDQLDVDHYLPPDPPGQAKPAAAGPEKPIDLAALRALRLDGKLAIGRLVVRHLQIADLHATLAAAAGHLRLAPLGLKLYQGSLNGTADVDANGNRIALKQDLSGVAIGPLLKDLMGKTPIDGHGNVGLDVTTGGATVTAMKKALAGSARVQLKDGAVNGINLAESFRKAKSLIGGGGAADQAADVGQKTDFSELSGSFQIRGGVAHNEDLSAKSPFLRLGGKGDIDIGNSRLDYLAQATVVATSGGQDGADLSGLRGIPVPVRVSGPFSAPAFHLEYADLLKGMAQAKVQQQVDQVRQQAKDKLQDAIKSKIPGAAGKGIDPADALKGLLR